MANLPENYQLRLGKPSDRYLLINFLTRTYQEFFPEQKNLSHLADTVRQFFCLDTPLWIVESIELRIGQKVADKPASVYKSSSITTMLSLSTKISAFKLALC